MCKLLWLKFFFFFDKYRTKNRQEPAKIWTTKHLLVRKTQNVKQKWTWTVKTEDCNGTGTRNEPKTKYLLIKWQIRVRFLSNLMISCNKFRKKSVQNEQQMAEHIAKAIIKSDICYIHMIPLWVWREGMPLFLSRVCYPLPPKQPLFS